jgi:hypothetical protein
MIQAARVNNTSVVVNSNNEKFTSEETDLIYRSILQYERKNQIKRLVTGRKTLEDEEKNPKTPTPVTLVQTRLAVVKFMIHYSILRAEIIKDGPNSPLLIKYLRHRIRELLAKYDTVVMRDERVNLSRTYKVLYDSHLHEKVCTFLAWMRDQLPSLSKENMTRLEANLPTYLFEFELDLTQDGPTKGTKRRFNDWISEDSGSDADEEMVTTQRSLHEQFFSGASQNIFPGRFTLQKGRSASEYPPGYFDCMIDTQEIPPNMTFTAYFEAMVRKRFEPFTGDHKTGMAYPTFFEKFRVSVHLRREDKVPIELKFITFKSLMKKGSVADNMLLIYKNRADVRRAYDECMRQFWAEFGTNSRKTLSRLQSALNSIKPKGKTNSEQMEFVHDVISQFNLLIQCGLSERSAALKSCKHIFDNLEFRVKNLFVIQKRMGFEGLDDYYEDNPRKELLEIPATLRKIFDHVPDHFDEDICMSAKNTEAKEEEPAGHLQAKATGAFSREPPSKSAFPPRDCVFCGSRAHISYLCPTPVGKRREIIKEKGLCFNCLRKTCPGVAHCDRDTYCRPCASVDPNRPKHSSWICNYNDNPYARAIQTATLKEERKPDIKREAKEPTPARKEESKPSGSRFVRRPAKQYSQAQVAKIVAAIASLEEATESPPEEIISEAMDCEEQEPGNGETAPTS